MPNDKVAIVTGTGSGVGQEIAHKLREARARVVVSDINEEPRLHDARRRRLMRCSPVVQTAMLGGLPYTGLRDAILTHPTTTEGLNVMLTNRPGMSEEGDLRALARWEGEGGRATSASGA